jgi:hypothetical protein
MVNGNAKIIVGSVRFGSVRFGSVRFGRSITPFFSACQVLFHTTYSEPVAKDRAHYALALALVFCVCRKDGGLILKS